MADVTVIGPGGYPMKLADQGDGSFAEVVQMVGDLVHVRKTIVLTGLAGAGQVGDFALFTLVGRIILERFSLWVDAGVSLGGGTINWGTANVKVGPSGSVNGASGFIIPGAVPPPEAAIEILSGVIGEADAKVLIAAPLEGTVGTADVTSGTLIADAWYRSITDNGMLIPA